ncbi:MAG: thymidylate synthase [Patescibacteria group bacterium]
MLAKEQIINSKEVNELEEKKWPIFSAKEVIIGNPEAQIAVCTLWSPREHFIKKYLGDLMNKIAVVGNLYSIFGIGILVRNCIANPNIQKLIVSGTELGAALTTLKRLSAIDSSLAAIFFLECCHLKRFLEQVEIFYLKPQEIADFICSSSSAVSIRQSSFEPLIIPLPEPKAKVFPAAQSGHLIRVETIKEGYLALLKEIRFFGHITGQDSEGHRRQELWELNMVITDQDPLDFVSVPHPEYDIPYIKKYCEDFWDGTEPSDLAYRYGHIIKFGFGNQMEAVVKAFKDKAETFRTVISLWNPRVDGGSITADDPPCLTLIHPRIIGQYLHQWAYIRTNDMFGGWPLNAMALRYFQYQLLECLKIELKRPELKLGELGVTSGSAHIYERDWMRIDAFLADQKPEKFHPDSKGNFEIRVEDGEIVVKHFSPAGDKLLQIFRGNNAEKLSKEMALFISDIGNALYIGRELKKAEIILNGGVR